MSHSARPHRRQPTRLPGPWDSPSKNTGVGCHFLLQCMKMKSESKVAQSCPTLRDPMDCSLPGSSILGFSRQEYWSGLCREHKNNEKSFPRTITDTYQYIFFCGCTVFVLPVIKNIEIVIIANVNSSYSLELIVT